MLVIADSSPFIALLKIGLIDILPQMYGVIVIPLQVASELEDSRRPAEVRTFIKSPPDWLQIKSPSVLQTIPNLGAGETAAISLALELHADLLVIDETKGRETAIARKIPTVRTAAILFEAANAGIISDLAEAFNQLKATNFRVLGSVLDEMLRLHKLNGGD